MHDTSNIEASKLWNNVNKGRGMNNQIMFSVFGPICNYSIGWKGNTHDSKASATLFEDLQSLVLNPGRIGCFIDSGFQGYADSGDQSHAPVRRPLIKEEVEEKYLAYFQAVSRVTTTFRQHNEWGNGGQ
jgi:hypothetical protein